MNDKVSPVMNVRFLQSYEPSMENQPTKDDADYVDILVKDVMDYHPWSEEQINAAAPVRAALSEALKAILKYVPPSADRSAAIRKLREVRMDCNSAITFNGRY